MQALFPERECFFRHPRRQTLPIYQHKAAQSLNDDFVAMGLGAERDKAFCGLNFVPMKVVTMSTVCFAKCSPAVTRPTIGNNY